MNRRAIVICSFAFVVAVLLSSCRPPHGPITYDVATHKAVSDAEWRVAPVTTQHGPGVDIRMRGCNSMTITGSTRFVNGTTSLAPVARITDAAGRTWVFGSGDASFAFISYQPDNPDDIPPYPAGTWFNDAHRWDEVDRIVVPVSMMKAPLEIQASCFAGDSRVYAGWFFDSCSTSTRSCPASRRGGVVYCDFCIPGP